MGAKQPHAKPHRAPPHANFLVVLNAWDIKKMFGMLKANRLACTRRTCRTDAERGATWSWDNCYVEHWHRNFLLTYARLQPGSGSQESKF
eukprot:1159877-Pelagomonas_calceolata.AAC.6